jgi:hypothetical protein
MLLVRWAVNGTVKASTVACEHMTDCKTRYTVKMKTQEQHYARFIQ